MTSANSFETCPASELPFASSLAQATRGLDQHQVRLGPRLQPLGRPLHVVEADPIKLLSGSARLEDDCKVEQAGIRTASFLAIRCRTFCC